MTMSSRFDAADAPLIILEDTRQQTGKHDNVHNWMQKNGVQLRRTKLFCGDYTLPTDQHICIDTKYGLQEVYGDLIGKDHDRFVRELENAKNCGILLIILVEEKCIKSIEDVREWRNPRRGQYYRTPPRMRPSKPPIPSYQLMKVMQTVAERHGCVWKFCAKHETGKRIVDILTGKEAANEDGADS